MPTKTVTIPEEQIDERVVYEVHFKCPYCNYGNDLEWEYMRPTSCKCFRCENKISLKIGKTNDKGNN